MPDAVLRAILSTAVADDLIARNPCRIVGAGQARSDERPLLDHDQVETLAEAMPSTSAGWCSWPSGDTCGWASWSPCA